MLPTQVRRVGRGGYEAGGLGDEFLNRMLRQWWGDGGEANGQGGSTGVYPVDVREDQDHFHVEAELPGFKKDEIEVTLENGMLHILAQRKPEAPPADQAAEQHLRERRFTRVSRSFTLPNTLNEGKVDARLEDGVLHLTLHKREEVKPRRIEVK